MSPELQTALDNILGPHVTIALLGDDRSNVTLAMEVAALKAFRQKRDDNHTSVLREAFLKADKGTL